MPNYCIEFNEQGHTYLAHYGINGQRWGIRNGPPYPLDYKSHSAAEKRSNPKRLLQGHTNGVTHSKDLDPFGYESKTNEQIARDVLKKNPNAAVANPDLKNWLRTHKKELLIGAGVIGTVAIGAYIATQSSIPIDAIGRLSKDGKEKTPNELLASKLIEAIKKEQVRESYGGFNSNEERFVAQWLKADMHRFDPITPEEFANLPDDDGVVLKAGAKMFRMSKGEHARLRSGIEYISFGEDRERYKGFLPQMWRANSLFAKPNMFYESELSAKTLIKAPGKKESIRILEQVMKRANPGISDELIHSYVLKNFYKLQLNLADRDNGISKQYFKEVSARGFNAVIDFNDAGRLADKPLILLNGAQLANVDSIKQYSLSDVKKVFKDVKLPSGTEDFNINMWNLEDKADEYRPYIAIYAGTV